MNLIAIALLRARAAAAGITEITQKDGAILLSLATMDFAAISGCCAEAQFKGRIFFSTDENDFVPIGENYRETFAAYTEKAYNTL